MASKTNNAWLAPAVVLLSSTAAADTAVTIYSKAQPGAVDPSLYRPVNGNQRGQTVPGYAIVRQDQRIELTAGRSEIRLTDVAALIDPTTVRFESLTDPDGTRVLEQDFRFDLIGTQKLLDRYIDTRISVQQVVGDRLVTVNGTLLSTQGGLVMQTEDGRIEVLTSWQNLSLAELPGGLMTRPTLIWDLTTRREGEHKTRVSYETQGATWWADYNLLWQPGRDDNKGTLSVAAWVSILNQTGASFDDAKLKLIAGDVQRATAASNMNPRRNMVMQRAMVAEDAGFSEQALFEFHLYTLERNTSIPQNSTKQIELFPQASGVPARKHLVFNGLPGYGGQFYGNNDRNFGAQSNAKVDVYLEFENREKNGLGIPLPAGRLRVSQADQRDGSLEFIGEDVIAHTPKNESLRIRLGSAFDVLGERKQTNYKVDNARRVVEESFEITLTNRKDQSQTVTIAEPLYRWANWEIVDRSDDFEKIDANLVHFEVSVPADSKRTVSYRVRYTW
ncbi:MAG: DUF4139 domain-containing protein [Woeseiaceae bacterium]